MSIEQQYSHLEHEPQRLAAVQSYALLGTPPEADFDALIRLLTRALALPVAWLGLLDAEQVWVKAQQGLGCTQLARDPVLMAHATAQPRECMVVSDVADDARWAGHDLLKALPDLRFVAAMPVVDAAGHVLGVIAVADMQPRQADAALLQALADAAQVALSVMEARRRALELGRVAMTDHLTGIGNKAQFDLALQVEMGHAMRSGEPFAVLCMDLDGFKAVNDGFGHTAGDEVLCEVAKRLQQQVRLGDTLVRLRDDEFAVVMRHGAEESADILSKRIAKAISVPVELTTGDTVGVGMSIGVGAYHDMVVSSDELVQQASDSLNQAKRRNEKRWHMFLGGGRRLF